MKEYLEEKLFSLKKFFLDRIFGFSVLFIIYFTVTIGKNGVTLTSIKDFLFLIFTLFGSLIFVIGIKKANQLEDHLLGADGEMNGENILERTKDFAVELNSIKNKIGYKVWRGGIIFLLIFVQLTYLSR